MNQEIPIRLLFHTIFERSTSLKRGCFVGFVLFLLLLPYYLKAQDDPIYDEISVYLQVKDIGGIEVPAVIKDDVVYLPLKDIFDFLKFKTSMSQTMDSISGFLITTKESYVLDYKNNKITFQGKTFQLKQGEMIRTESNLYLLSKYFGEVFGLNSKYSIRTLSVNMETKLELPAMREKRLEQMRQNINRITGEVKTDTTIKRSFPLFHFGMADWSVIGTQQIGQKEDTRINLALGSVLAGGEANFMLNYNTNEAFNEKQQYYYLRYVNNNRSWLRQTIFGKIGTDAISSIYNPVVGMRLTNTPTTYRRSFGTYNLSDYTTPNWTVELYVNNVLVDYKKADASGFFNFQVPLVYGNSQVKLKFYGPWGEERVKEQTLTIPFNFMPVKKLEYTLVAGMVEDSTSSIFSKGSFNYGVSKSITVGAGVEYLSSVNSGPIMPFITMSTRPLSNLILTGEYAYGVRGKGLLSYQFKNNIQLELNYTKYVPGQKAVNYNYLEERKAILSLPVKAEKFSLYNRMTYNQIIMPGTKYSTAEWLISGSLFGVNTNLTNYAMFSENSKPYTYSNLSLSLRLPGGYMVLPQTQYNYSQGQLISAKIGIEKYILKNGFISLSYENNFLSKVQMAQIGFRYDFPFAQTGFTARQSNAETTLMEVARGSLIMDAKTRYFGANNRTSVGKGALVFAPFLDLNCNDKRDPGEPKDYNLNIRISGGKPFQDDKDSTIRVLDLEPYTSYYVELDQNSFDNVAWKLRKKTMTVVVDPNQFKLIEVPIAVVGEVSGTVYKKGKGEPAGLGRIVVNFFDKNSKLVGKTLTEPDGYFSYLGLAPGKYYAQVDTSQLKRVQMSIDTARLPFNIKPSRDGDIVEGIDFTLTSLKAEEEPVMPDLAKEQLAQTDKSKESAAQADKTKVTPAQPVTEADKNALAAADAAKKAEQKALANQALSKAAIDKTLGVTQADQTTGKSASDKAADAKPIAAVPAETKPVPTTPSATKPDSSQKTAISKTPAAPTTIVTRGKQYFVQVGAFIDQKNAKRVATYLSHATPYKVQIVVSGMYSKVRLGGFSTSKEAEDCIRLMDAKGIENKESVIVELDVISTTTVAPTKPNNAAITSPPANSETTPATSKKDTTPPTSGNDATSTFTKTVATPPVSTMNATPPASKPDADTTPYLSASTPKVVVASSGPTIQLGLFQDKDNALKCVDKMASEAPYPIKMVAENGKYAVRFGPFSNVTEAQNCLTLLKKKGYSCFIKL